MPFVTTNIAKNGGPEDWRWREAATFAFGSIMEGPMQSNLVPMVQQAMPFLLQVRGLHALHAGRLGLHAGGFWAARACACRCIRLHEVTA